MQGDELQFQGASAAEKCSSHLFVVGAVPSQLQERPHGCGGEAALIARGQHAHQPRQRASIPAHDYTGCLSIDNELCTVAFILGSAGGHPIVLQQLQLRCHQPKTLHPHSLATEKARNPPILTPV